jgi:hypothetical protein
LERRGGDVVRLIGGGEEGSRTQPNARPVGR